MVPYLGVPMVSFNLAKSKKLQPHEMYVNGHYQSEKLKAYIHKFDSKINFLHEEEILGTAGTISSLLKNMSSDHLLVANGDIICDANFQDLIKQHLNSKALVTMLYREHNLVSNPVYFKENRLLGIGENKDLDKNLKRSFCGVYVVKKELLEMFQPGDFDIINVFKRCVGEISGLEHGGYWEDLGSIEDYLKSQSSGLENKNIKALACLLYTSPSPRDKRQSRMPSSA